MSEFKKYKRTNIAELRPVTLEEVCHGLDDTISISQADLDNHSPKVGDMIARNPENHDDKWLVRKEFFESNFESLNED